MFKQKSSIIIYAKENYSYNKKVKNKIKGNNKSLTYYIIFRIVQRYKFSAKILLTSHQISLKGTLFSPYIQTNLKHYFQHQEIAYYVILSLHMLIQ